MRRVVGLIALICAGACQAPLETSSTSQLAVVVSPATHDFGTVQVGQSSGAYSIVINPAAGANSDLINSVSESCADFSVSATGLPAEVYRDCEPPGGCTTELAPCIPPAPPGVPLLCVTEDLESYAFTATFTPTVPGPLSCVITIVLDTSTTQTVSITGTGMAPPVEIGVSPTSIAFGDVRAATASSTAAVTVRDLGGSTLTVSSATVSAGYALAGPNAFSVTPGTSTQLGVTCEPPAVGADNGSLVIVSNDPAQGTITIPLTCNGVTSNLQISPSPATLPPTLVGAPISAPIVLGNEGGASTTIESVSIAGTGLSLTTAPIAGTTLGSGTSVQVEVAFDAAAHGSASGTLTVVTSDGTRTSQVSATALLATLSITPDGDVDLGPVCVGAMATQTFTVIGNGDGPFDLESLSMPDAPFALAPPVLPAAVQASGGNQVAFDVAVAPTAAGPVTSELTLTTDIPNDAPHAITLAALGLPAGTSATPATLDLGSSPLETTTIGAPIQLTNCSATDLGFTNARIAGSNASEFAIVAQPPMSSIAADASATWLVVMSAHTAGLKSATFSVDTADGATTSVPLTGEGLSPDLGSGSGSDDGATGEHNYYSCSTGGGDGLAPAGLAIALAIVARRKRRAR